MNPLQCIMRQFGHYEMKKIAALWMQIKGESAF